MSSQVTSRPRSRCTTRVLRVSRPPSCGAGVKSTRAMVRTMSVDPVCFFDQCTLGEGSGFYDGYLVEWDGKGNGGVVRAPGAYTGRIHIKHGCRLTESYSLGTVWINHLVTRAARRSRTRRTPTKVSLRSASFGSCSSVAGRASGTPWNLRLLSLNRCEAQPGGDWAFAAHYSVIPARHGCTGCSRCASARGAHPFPRGRRQDRCRLERRHGGRSDLASCGGASRERHPHGRGSPSRPARSVGDPTAADPGSGDGRRPLPDRELRRHLDFPGLGPLTGVRWLSGLPFALRRLRCSLVEEVAQQPSRNQLIGGFETLAGASLLNHRGQLIVWFRDARRGSLLNHRESVLIVVVSTDARWALAPQPPRPLILWFSRLSLALAPQPPKPLIVWFRDARRGLAPQPPMSQHRADWRHATQHRYH